MTHHRNIVLIATQHSFNPHFKPQTKRRTENFNTFCNCYHELLKFKKFERSYNLHFC